jgi:outer membrane protein OmpA-like peptidoglycan-associated protein/Tol biopolymer transport system component
MKAYTEGVRNFDFLDYQRAEANFKEAISIDNRFLEAYLMLGDLQTKQRKFSDATASYRKAVKIDSLFYKPIFFTLANAEFKSGDYQNALNHYNVYLAQEGMSEKNKLFAAKNVRNCEFALNAIKNPVLFNPESVGDGINTPDDEYWPSITADGETLIFTRQMRGDARGSQNMEDFYISNYSDNKWQKAVNAGYPLNTNQNEGAQSLSSDGSYMYFTACDRQGGMGSCDIYYSSLSDGKWSEPANLRSPVNTSAWESQPSISSDGRTLFFTSSRSGGSGGKDLWLSRLDDKKIWSKPVNLGKTINTEGDEMSPFIHFDGKTLYFASDGRAGMGGFDIYRSTMKSDSTWEEPQNLGYPINTYNDEMGLITGSDGQIAYFSSIRNSANGKDIFCFNLYESARPDPVSYIKGKVYDSETGKLLRADYELINLSNEKISLKSTTDGTGSFLVCLPSGYNYGINVSKTGYLFYSESFMLEGQHSIAEPYVKRINLNPIKVGEKMQLSNVFYEVDSWELKNESILELNNLVKLLTLNNDIVIEIGGYTDSTGSAEYNMGLSEKRALSVVNYLVKSGIPQSRLRYKGYGNTAPIGDNITSEGRKMNRRTEAKIIAQKK